MRIGIDIDDVLNNLTNCVLYVYNSDANDNLRLNDITEYDMKQFVKPEYQKNFFKYFIDKRVWALVKPNNVAFDLINKLHSEGHSIYFVTATHPLNIKNKYLWLNKYLKWDCWDSLVVTKDKTIITGLDILLDDNVSNLGYQNENNTIFVLYSKPWNIHKEPLDVIRMDSWEWFEQLVNILSKEREVGS